MLTTTRSLARFLRGEGPAHPSGVPSSIVIMSPLQRPTTKMQRFSYMHHRIDNSGLLQTLQNSKSIGSCDCPGMPALLGLTEKAGVGGSTPSLATILIASCF